MLAPALRSSLLLTGAAAALVSLSAPVAAQVPYGYVAVGHRTNATTNALVFVDPASGNVTPVRSLLAADTMKEILTFALDPANPGVIWAAGATSGFLGGEVWPLSMQGNEHPPAAKWLPTGMPGFAFPKDYQVAGTALLMTVSGGSNNGLYQIDVTNKSVVKLPVAVPNFAGDIAVIGTKAYVMSDDASNPSTIVEWDLTAQQSRVVGATYPRLRSLTTFGGNLLAGTHAGDLVLITTATGTLAPLAQPGKGPILTVATSPTSEVFFSVDNAGTHEVWALSNAARPIYTSTFAISELRCGVHDQASLLRFGAGCPGTNNLAARFGYVNVPSLGNPAFTLQVLDATPSRAAAVLLGSSRQNVDLTPAGMPACTLFTNVLVTLGTTTNPAGMAQVTFAIPNVPALRGGSATAQWGIVDPGANPVGVTASDGAELLVR